MAAKESPPAASQSGTPKQIDELMDHCKGRNKQTRERTNKEHGVRERKRERENERNGKQNERCCVLLEREIGRSGRGGI